MPMNHDLWWRFPGPPRFIDEVMQDFRDGKNVIICIPDWTSAMPLTGIRTTVDYEHDWGSGNIEDQCRKSYAPYRYAIRAVCSGRSF